MLSDDRKKVHLVLMDKKPSRHFLASIFSSEHAGWVYLGKNVSLVLDIEKTLDGTSCKKIDIGDLLQTTARDTRQSYIDYVGNLFREEYGITWWLTSVSEKNPRISDLFLYSCYLRVAEILAAESDNDLVFLCESRSLMLALSAALQKNTTLDVRSRYPAFVSIRHLLFRSTGFITGYSFFLLRWTLRWFLAHVYCFVTPADRGRSGSGDMARVLLHSWTDQRSFSKPAAYQEVYLGSLGDELTARKYSVQYLIDVLPTLFYPVALLKLRTCRQDCIPMERFLSPVDILYAMYVGIFCLPLPEEIPLYRGMDISPVIRDEIQNDRLHPRAAQAYLCYAIGKRIQKTCPPRMFVYSFENLMWEKMFCASLKSTSPDIRITGYAHSVVDPMYLFYSISERERSIMPLPDRIIVNGKRAKDVLAASGFPDEMIFVGGAFRYPQLSVSAGHIRHTRKKTICIATAAGIGETLELIRKARIAFGEKEGIVCKVKLHPTLPSSILAQILPLPGNFELCDEPVQVLLPAIDLLVYTSSAISVEALAGGVKILHVKSDFFIDMNIFADDPEVRSVSTPEELFTESCRTIADPQYSDRFITSALEGFFMPVTPSSIDHFVSLSQPATDGLSGKTTNNL